MAHQVFDSPPSSPVLDMEMNPSEASSASTDTHSSDPSTPHRNDQIVLNIESAAIVENGFDSP